MSKLPGKWELRPDGYRHRDYGGGIEVLVHERKDDPNDADRWVYTLYRDGCELWSGYYPTRCWVMIRASRAARRLLEEASDHD